MWIGCRGRPEGHVVIAAFDGELTVKRLKPVDGKPVLTAGNRRYL